MKNRLQILSACLGLLITGAPLALHAAAKTSPSPNAASAPASSKTAPPPTQNKTERAVPFHGKISAVDQTAKTFTIAGKEKARVFKVTDKTHLTKAGAPATMKDVQPKDEVRGTYVKAADGSLDTRIVKLGPMTDAEKAASPKKSKKKAKAEAAPSASPAP
jgi:predicted amidohydrolase